MMEPTDGSPPNSMYMVRCGEMFPKPPVEKEDDKLRVPFKELPGEGVKYIGVITDGVLALTNYRIFVLWRKQEKSVPLGLIDTVQTRDMLHLIVNCKDANTVKCSFETAEKCSEWQRRITTAVTSLINPNALFAFPFYAWSSEQSEQVLQHHQRAMSSVSRSSSPGNGFDGNGHNASNGTLATFATEAEWSSRLRKISSRDYDEEFRKEVDRLQFNLRGAWRISTINEDFKLCPSYPRHFLVPTYITDEVLQSVANFRSSRRIPVAVWRHRTTGAIIARCSQPEVGWLGWRNNKDEELLEAFVNACAYDQGEQLESFAAAGEGPALMGMVVNGGDADSCLANNRLSTASDAESATSSNSPEGSPEEVRMDKPKKLLIVDARSYASAVTNRARGGGCECIDYYPSAEIQFMNLANIHAVRKSFNALRQLCASPPDMGSWLSNLEKTMWLQHLSGLLAASVTVTRMIEVEGRPVLVHCSDGWDRTPQIVATAQLCLDPHYRTVDGFRTLVEREWLSFGHKFGDRCGHGPSSSELNERCPVFLQWLDCVHQIHNQFPCSFEFSIGYLIKLAQHSHSMLFGTFLMNTMRERIEHSIFDRTYSVWPFLAGPMYKNPLYVPSKQSVLWPAFNIRDLTLWNEVYLGQAGSAPSEVLGSAKMETMLERMESTEDGEDKLDLVMGGLSLGCEDEDDEKEGDDGEESDGNAKESAGMAKTRSYNDLLETTGSSSGPHRRCSDPHMPIELLKQQQNGGADVLRRPQIPADDLENDEDTTQLPKSQENGLKDVESKDSVENQKSEPTREMTEVESPGVTTVINRGPDLPCLDVVLPDGVLANPQQDAVDGSPSPPLRDSVAHLADVMLESVDLRSAPSMVESVDFGGLTLDNVSSLIESTPATPGGSALWHGSVETSTDTLVPTTGTLTEEESRHFAGDLENFLTKRAENEEVRVERMTESVVDNGFECSVYGENSFNMGLLNNDSIYGPLPTTAEGATRAPDTALNLMDMSLMASVIQSQPLSAAMTKRRLDSRHRRTPSNSKSEPSPHKFQNGRMSPSATMNSRFSTPGGRSPNMTPPEVNGGGAVFERASNVILSCPDGLAHALSEQNIRLQQIIYEHKLREEALQRELNATRMALLKRICQCNNGNNGVPEPVSNNEDQAVAVLEEELLFMRVMGSAVDGHRGRAFDVVDVVGDELEEEEDDESSESSVHIELSSEEEDAFRVGDPSVLAMDVDVAVLSEADTDEDEELPNMLQSFYFDDLPSLSPLAKTSAQRLLATNPNLDAAENISVCSWEAVEDRGGGSGTSSASDQMLPTGASANGTGGGNSKVLWVPDHAVNECTGCSFEFWLGRRKHHCRSCGKIFCSDCSEFFAALPEERLYNPVRLCAPCYVTVTQSQHEQQQQEQRSKHQIGSSELKQQQHQLSQSQVLGSNNHYSSIVNNNYNHPRPAPPVPLSSSTLTKPAQLHTTGTILRNNSSCSLELGHGTTVLTRDSPMSVSEGGQSLASNGTNGCNGGMKTATASN